MDNAQPLLCWNVEILPSAWAVLPASLPHLLQPTDNFAPASRQPGAHTAFIVALILLSCKKTWWDYNGVSGRKCVGVLGGVFGVGPARGAGGRKAWR